MNVIFSEIYGGLDLPVPLNKTTIITGAHLFELEPSLAKRWPGLQCLTLLYFNFIIQMLDSPISLN